MGMRWVPSQFKIFIPCGYPWVPAGYCGKDVLKKLTVGRHCGKMKCPPPKTGNFLVLGEEEVLHSVL